MPGEKIIAIQKDANGGIAKVKTNNGRLLTIDEAMEQARRGGFDSLSAIDEDGNWYIPQTPGNGKPAHGGNLTILPEFEE